MYKPCVKGLMFESLIRLGSQMNEGFLLLGVVFGVAIRKKTDLCRGPSLNGMGRLIAK